MESSKKTQFTVLAIIAAAYAPLLWLHFRRLWTSEQYQHFPLVLVAVASLFWIRCRSRQTGVNATGVAPSIQFKWLLAAFITLTSAVLLWSPWLAALSFVIFSYHALRYFAGDTNRSTAPVWALLLLLLPLPFGWGERLTFWVQGVASQASSFLLDFFAVNHLLSGHILRVPGREFPVQDACGGIPSFFSLVALAAILAVCLRRPLIHAMLLLVAGGFWAVVIGVLRLTSVVLLQARYGVDLSSGLEEHLLEIGSLAIAAWMLFCSDRLLIFLLAPIEDKRTPNDVDPPDSIARQPIPTGASTKRLVIVAGCFALLGAAQVFDMIRGPERQMDSRDNRQLVSSLRATTLPNHMLNRKQTSFVVDGDAAHSAKWTYMGDGGPCTATFDFPLAGWQYSIGCYEAEGWEVLSREVLNSTEEGSPNTPALLRARLKDGSGNRGLLFVSRFEPNGDVVVPPGTAGLSLSSWVSALQHRLTRRLADYGYERTTYQVQMLLSHSPPQADLQPTETEALKAFQQIRQCLQHCLKEAASEHNG